MKFEVPNILATGKVNILLKIIALSIFSGFSLGYLIFYSIFPELSAPFQNEFSSLYLILVLVIIGIIIGILLEEIEWCLVGTLGIVASAALFSSLIFSSPGMSGELISLDVSSDIFMMIRLSLPHAIMSFIVIFLISFFGIHLNDTYLIPDPRPFKEWEDRNE